MSLITKGIGIAKGFKHKYEAELKARTPVYLSPVRRIERVSTDRRICAMTFDDGPFALPPSTGGEKSLTLSLLETLESFDAKGTFDIVGDTSANYPDTAGKEGSAMWGGKRYDHYPDINRDDQGGALHCPQLTQRILDGGHELTNHSYAHIIYGKKPLVYFSRKYMGDIDKVIADTQKLHTLIQERHGYTMKLGRPPHYVDNISKGLSSYDAYAATGYQYMAASYDGAGWLPLSSYQAEVDATYRPMEKLLSENPDALCGQIIFQKDGYNMARRTPVVDGLRKQLEILSKHGYQVVTVSQLLSHCAFRDLPTTHPSYAAAAALLEGGYCVTYRDNTLRLHQPVTRGELAMMVYGSAAVGDKIAHAKAGHPSYALDVPQKHPYGAAIALALLAGTFPPSETFRPDDAITMEELTTFLQVLHGDSAPSPTSVERSDILSALAEGLTQ